MTSSTALPDHVRVLVIGAGFAGLGTAIQLDEHGFGDFLVLDKGATVGGTWRDNTYPGAACDVPSHLYSFSFAPNAEWSRFFATQPEIQAYLERTATGAGVLDRFRFGVTVEDLTWEQTERRWRVTTSAGDVTADVVVSGAGGLSEPKLPDIEGLDDFDGTLFHSARWDHDTDLTGKRVAVIGTGASAIQIVPEIAKNVSHLDVYQRTPAWVVPRTDPRFTRSQRFALRHLPGARQALRTGVYLFREAAWPGFALDRRLSSPVRAFAEVNLRRISDPTLRAAVTPDFEIGCKRILLSNTYYPALSRDHVDLVTDRIARVTPTGIVTRNDEGVETERAVDAIVVATGFAITDQPLAHHIKGLDGRTLADVWSEHGMAAYKGTTIAGFPNLFQVVGPNTGLGHSSMIYIIESQVAYIVSALREMGEHGIATLSPKPEVQSAWNDDLQRRMRRTVWNSGGCASWYLDEHGRNTTLWPRATFTMRRLLRRFDLDQYDVTRTQEDAA